MRIVTAGTVLGVGLGGFMDGIALHQIAEWHNMGSAILALGGIALLAAA